MTLMTLILMTSNITEGCILRQYLKWKDKIDKYINVCVV